MKTKSINNTTNKKKQKKDVDKHYVSIKHTGIDFRKLSELITKAGYSANHATSRNILVQAIHILLQDISTEMKTKITTKQIDDMIAQQELHNQMSDILFTAYKQLEEESDNKVK